MTKEEFLALKEGSIIINKYSGEKFSVVRTTTWSLFAKNISRETKYPSHFEIGTVMQYYDGDKSV